MARTVPASIQTGIDNGKICLIVKITTKKGDVVGFTDHDKQLTVDSVTYQPAPGLQRIRLTASDDFKVSDQEVVSAMVNVDEDDIIAGAYDEAQVDSYFVAWDTVESTDDVLPIFSGELGLIQWTEEGFRADLQQLTRKLRKNIGFITTPGCRHELFSQFDSTHIGACTLNAASYTDTGSVSSVLTQRIKVQCSTAFDRPTGWFDNAKFTWTTGPNTGLSSEVKKHTRITATNFDVTFFLPTIAPITAGDSYSIVAGCDKTLATCKNKFNNVVNFGGFPHLKPEVNYK